MNLSPDRPAAPQPPSTPAWAAVIAVTLGVFSLVTAEFLPSSLLTPMAADIGISEGMAGQSVTVTAITALLVSLFVSAATRSVDRRRLLIGFTVLMIVSNLLVALAPNLVVLFAGRVLLGAALGGFWTMSAAIIMRLVPEDRVPRALSIMFTGVSAATVVAVPVGSYLGDIVGWRAVFLMTAGVGALVLAVQAATLPNMTPTGHIRLKTMADVLARPGIALGMVASLLVFGGHFAFFTYVRPFLETVSGAGIAAVSTALLGFGIANLVGTFVAGFLIERSLRATLSAMPLLMAALGSALTVFGGDLAASSVLIAIWGFAFGLVPVAWSTWLTRAAPDQAESAGGLLVAGIQFAIAAGAAAGGAIFDAAGGAAVAAASAAVLLAAAIMIAGGIRSRAPAPARAVAPAE